jgi:hypothetical protein
MRLYIHGDEPRHGRHDEGIWDAYRAKVYPTTKLLIRTLAELHAELTKLANDGKTFNRVLWMTHGSPGAIHFSNDSTLSSAELRSDFSGKGYEKLFPKPTKMYFSGCNVAATKECQGACPAVKGALSNAGWDFLETAGRVFLHGGGYTFAWTSLGRSWDHSFGRFVMGGHSIHFSGDVRYVTFGPKGQFLERLSNSTDIFKYDIFNQMSISEKLSRVFPE